jgi:hypothetical protein
MKKIVTILSAALLLLAGTNAFAQMSVGAGYVNSTNSLKFSKNGDASTTAINGFYAGVGYTIPISSLINFTPGVYYEFLANKNVEGEGAFTLSGALTEHYLNVPLTFSLGGSVAPGIRLFAFAGPTATFGLASTTDTSASVAGISLGGKTNNYDNSDYGRFDVMLGGGAGIQFSNVRLTVGYDYGMLNRYTGDSDSISRHTSRLHVGLGFAF